MSIFDQSLGGGDSHAWEVSKAEATVLNQGCSGLKFQVKAAITSRLRKVHVFLPFLFSLSSSPSANGTRNVEMLEKKKDTLMVFLIQAEAESTKGSHGRTSSQ